jgi:hypothetical protein
VKGLEKLGRNYYIIGVTDIAGSVYPRRITVMKAIFFLIMSAVLMTGSALWADNQMKSDSPAKPIVAVIDYVKGDVSVKKADSVKWMAAKVKDKLTAEDMIRTLKTGEIRIMLVKDQSKIKLASSTEDKVGVLIAKSMQVNDSLKNVMNKFNKKKDDSTDVTAVAGVRGNKVGPEKTTKTDDPVGDPK